MKILLTSPELSSLTGQPNFTKNLAKGLSSLGGDVTCSEQPSGHYDLAIINDYFPQALRDITATRIFNYCHSMNDCDQPIEDPRIQEYIVPREEVAIAHRIEALVIPIPIVFERWRTPLLSHKPYRIIAPCTTDEQRLPMLRDLVNRANEECEVLIVGKDVSKFRSKVDNDYVWFIDATKDIEKIMRTCDEVAGLHIGTVTLEAWAMGLKTSVYDLKGNWKYVDKPKDFDKHDHISVARKIINLL